VFSRGLWSWVSEVACPKTGACYHHPLFLSLGLILSASMQGNIRSPNISHGITTILWNQRFYIAIGNMVY
jgi:hypothetical protein